MAYFENYFLPSNFYFVKYLFVVLFLTINSLSFCGTFRYLPIPSVDLVKHSYYVLSYNEKYEQANWVYYELSDSMVLNGGEERSNKFKIDKLVVSGSAKSSDYTKSGYDRGHLCPAADMGFNKVAMEESFLMSNISPQAPDFNRGIWKELESTVRNWAKQEHRIIVVTGPVFKDTKGTIGQDGVVVPGYFFKIIYDATDQPRMVAFILPNEKSNRPLTDFAVSTDEAEKITGLDFFSQLPDDLESQLESKVELAGWFSGYEPKEPVLAKKQDNKMAVQNKPIYFYLILLSVILLVILFVAFKGRRRK
jgi:endonuclease G